jgi:hypothetical protein
MTVIRTVRIGRRTLTQFLKRKLKMQMSKIAMGGKNRKLSLTMYLTYSVLKTETPEYVHFGEVLFVNI